MTTVEPYKDHQELDEIMVYLKENHKKYYLLAVFAVQTGVFLVDVVNTRVSEVADCVSYTNPKNGVSFSFDSEFSTYIRSYIASLMPGTVYLFPARGNIEGHATIPTICKQFANFSSKIGIPLSYLRFQKTFALNYFLKKGTLVGTNLCHPGRGEAVVCKYLCITSEQYQRIISHQTVLDLSGRAMELDNIAHSKEQFDKIIDDYFAYLKTNDYDADYETATSRFLQQHNAMVAAYIKKISSGKTNKT